MPMGCKKSRRVRKIEVSTDSVSEFELGDIVVDIQWRMQEREAREREAQQQREEEARRQEQRNHTCKRELQKKAHDRKKVTLKLALVLFMDIEIFINSC